MSEDDNSRHGFCSFVKSFFNRRQPETVRETIEDLLEEANIKGDLNVVHQHQRRRTVQRTRTAVIKQYPVPA